MEEKKYDILSLNDYRISNNKLLLRLFSAVQNILSVLHKQQLRRYIHLATITTAQRGIKET